MEGLNVVVVLVLSSITGAIGAAIVVWLFKSWVSERIKGSIQYEYGKELEAFKATLRSEYDTRLAELRARLQGEHDVQIERLRADLSIASSAREIRYRRLHDEIATTIPETYRLLIAIRDASADYTRIFEFEGDKTKAERREVVNGAMREFRTYFEPRKIFLPKKTSQLIVAFIRELRSRLQRVALAVESERRGSDATTVWVEVSDFVEKEVPTLLDGLESDFRSLLGHAE